MKLEAIPALSRVNFLELGKRGVTGMVHASGEIMSTGIGVDTEEVVHSSSRVLLLGWSFFVLITTSSCECSRSNLFVFGCGRATPVRSDTPV